MKKKKIVRKVKRKKTARGLKNTATIREYAMYLRLLEAKHALEKIKNCMFDESFSTDDIGELSVRIVMFANRALNELDWKKNE